MTSSGAETTLERAEQLADRVLPDRAPKKRMLVIVNPYATTVSDRLKSLVVYALQGRYAVEAIDTEARDHATQLCREAAEEGYDVVVAFGGDGTVNEAANGLVGTGTPLTCLPGGATNVYCRTLGIPTDVVDATEHLLRMADDFRPRRVDTGLVTAWGGPDRAQPVSGRHFVFASGVGLDASVVERVDSHPQLKARLGYWYFTYAAVTTFSRKYLFRPVNVRVEAGGREIDGVTVIVQNSDPFTYFRNRPIRIGEHVDLESASLSLTVLKKATPLELPTVMARVFSARASTVQKHRQIEGLTGLEHARVTTLDGRPFPVQVDGDFIGSFEEIAYGVAPRALAVVS